MMVFFFFLFLFYLETHFGAYWANFQNPLSPFHCKKKPLGMGGMEESRDYFFIAFKHVLVSGRTAASLTI